jgi:hypothetical protein
MRLLLITATILAGFLAFTMIFFKNQEKKCPGFGDWTVGASLIAWGYLLYVLRGVIPDAVSIIIGSVLFPAGIVFYLQGMRKFIGLSGLPLVWWVFPFTTFVCCSYYYFVCDDPAMRSLCGSLVLAIPHLETARLVFKQLSKEKFLFYPIIALEMTIASAVFIARGFWAILIPSFTLLMDSPAQHGFFIAMMVFQTTITISFIMLNTERLQRQLLVADGVLKSKVEELEQALSQVKTLSGLLPICANCKKIHDDKDHWIHIETYIRDRSEADFTHGLCPECAHTLYPELWKDK